MSMLSFMLMQNAAVLMAWNDRSDPSSPTTNVFRPGGSRFTLCESTFAIADETAFDHLSLMDDIYFLIIFL